MGVHAPLHCTVQLIGEIMVLGLIAYPIMSFEMSLPNLELHTRQACQINNNEAPPALNHPISHPCSSLDWRPPIIPSSPRLPQNSHMPACLSANNQSQNSSSSSQKLFCPVAQIVKIIEVRAIYLEEKGKMSRYGPLFFFELIKWVSQAVLSPVSHSLFDAHTISNLVLLQAR